MKSNGNVLVIGSSNTDFVVEIDRLPAAGETRLGGSFFTAAGGKGANQAVAAARSGAHVTLVASVGNDDLGNRAIEGFAREGIDTSHVSREEASPSGVAFILVDKAGENSIIVASGANAALGARRVEDAASAFERADVCLLQLETPLDAVARSLELAAAANVRTILNPAPALELSDEHLRGLYLITPNESETELLTGIRPTTEDEAMCAAERIRRRGVANVIITLGERGSLLLTAAGLTRIPTPSVVAVDTTAAGDAYNGALSAGLARGLRLEEAARYGSCAGALAAMQKGAQPSLPRHEQIMDLFLRLPRSQGAAPTG